MTNPAELPQRQAAGQAHPASSAIGMSSPVPRSEVASGLRTTAVGNLIRRCGARTGPLHPHLHVEGGPHGPPTVRVYEFGTAPDAPAAHP